jgi:hypothetical protein
MFVIDPDGPEGAATVDGMDLPPTLTVVTGNGRHLYFFAPEGVEIRNRARVAPGLDVRGDGGYVIAPPSVHESGRVYAWVDQDAEIAEAPEWLVELVRVREFPAPARSDIPRNKFLGNVTPYARAALDAEVRNVLDAQRGVQNDTLNRAAFALGQLVASGALPESEVCSALMGAWDALEPGNGPGMAAGERTMRSGLESGMRYPREVPERPEKQEPRRARVTAQLGTRQPEEAPDDPDTVLEVARAAVNPSPNGWKRLTAAELLTMTFDPIRWAVPGLLPEGLCVFGGRPKARKSWLMLQMAIARATGGMFLGQELEPSPVVYFALEDGPRRLADRLRALECPTNVVGLIFQTGMPPIGRGGVEYVSEIVESSGAGLVVVDTISRALDRGVGRGVDQDKNADMTSVLNPLQRFALEWGLALVVVDHLRKTGIQTERNPVEEVMGSTAKVGVSDTIWGLYRKKGEHRGQLSIVGRDVEERDLVVEFQPTPAAWQMVGDAEDVSRSEVQQRYLDALRSLGPSDASMVARHLAVSSQSAGDVLRRLVDGGRARVTREHAGKAGRPRYVYSIREGSDEAWSGSWWSEPDER